MFEKEDVMKNDIRKHIFIHCCYGYGISGMAVLVIGAVLPSIIEEAGISFLAAGGLLSIMAIGNFLASFLFPVMVSSLGHRGAITVMTSLVPPCLLGLTLLPPLPVMYCIMLIYGLARGCVTIINNSAVNDIYEDEAAGKLNILHCSFAIGAFSAPFITAIMLKSGMGWKAVIYLLIVLTATSAFSYGTMHTELLETKEKNVKKAAGKGRDSSRIYLKSLRFYCIAFLLFFYLGVENCINGWFVTYLQNTGVMDETYATTLVSITWLVIMIGRLFCAYISKKTDRSVIILMNAVGSAACFILLISTKSLSLITVALVGFGFFLSGIYPTSIADAGPLIQGSTGGMALLTAISALGGIITPQLVGGLADHVGIVAAIGMLAVNVTAVVLLALFNAGRDRKWRKVISE